MLTEKKSYRTTIDPCKSIYMEEIIEIWKDDGETPYSTTVGNTRLYQPGDNPSSLPDYGQQLAKMLWTPEVVKAFEDSIPEPEAEPEPIE